MVVNYSDDTHVTADDTSSIEKIIKGIRTKNWAEDVRELIACGFELSKIQKSNFASMFKGDMIIDWSNSKISFENYDFILQDMQTHLTLGSTLSSSATIPSLAKGHLYLLVISTDGNYTANQLEIIEYSSFEKNQYILAFIVDNEICTPYINSGAVHIINENAPHLSVIDSGKVLVDKKQGKIDISGALYLFNSQNARTIKTTSDGVDFSNLLTSTSLLAFVYDYNDSALKVIEYSNITYNTGIISLFKIQDSIFDSFSDPNGFNVIESNGEKIYPEERNQFASFNDVGNAVLDFQNQKLTFANKNLNTITTLDYSDRRKPTLSDMNFDDLTAAKIYVVCVTKELELKIYLYNEIPEGAWLLVAFKPTGSLYHIYGNQMGFVVIDSQGLQIYPQVGNDGAKLSGKTLNILGDSYAKNDTSPVEKTWHYKLAKKYGMTYNNYGVNGNGMVTPDGKGMPMVDRFNEMADGADYIIVVGGKNDYNKQLPIDEFKTGISTIIKGLVAKYISGKICFFTPWSLGDADDEEIKLSEYAQAIEDECNLFGIACFNSNKRSNITPWDADFRKKYMQSVSDVSHLNGDGHDRFLPRAEAFLKTL